MMTRMQTYFTDGTAVSDDGRGRGQKNMPDRVAAAEKNANWGNTSKQDLAEYLATLNLSGGRTTWPFELKTLPRPTGKATRVIITQYDMPRPDTVSHDLDLDSKGTLVHGRKPDVLREDGSENRQVHRVSLAGGAARRPARGQRYPGG